MTVILPETKGISLERMEKIFGEVDFVEAGENETAAEKIEASAYSTAHDQNTYGNVIEMTRHDGNVENGDGKPTVTQEETI